MADITGNVPSGRKAPRWCHARPRTASGHDDAFGVGEALELTEMETQRNAWQFDKLDVSRCLRASSAEKEKVLGDVRCCVIDLLQRAHLNGAGAAHSGCIAYLVAKCANNHSCCERRAMRKLTCFPQNDVQPRERSSCHSWAINKDINGVGRDTEPTKKKKLLRIMHIMHQLSCKLADRVGSSSRVGLKGPSNPSFPSEVLVFSS